MFGATFGRHLFGEIWRVVSGIAAPRPRIIDLVGEHRPNVDIVGVYATSVDVAGSYITTIDMTGSVNGN